MRVRPRQTVITGQKTNNAGRLSGDSFGPMHCHLPRRENADKKCHWERDRRQRIATMMRLRSGYNQSTSSSAKHDDQWNEKSDEPGKGDMLNSAGDDGDRNKKNQ